MSDTQEAKPLSWNADENVGVITFTEEQEPAIRAFYAEITTLQSQLREALDEVEGLRKRVEWQPIETAPKDGNYFIAYDPHYGLIFTMHWDEYTKIFMTCYEPWSGVFTHWLPIPAAPAEAALRELKK